MRKRAFTLVELIIVLVVIMVLAAILFSVFAVPHGPRENAKRAACQSNLKQIGLAIAQYTQDFNEKFPLAGINTTAGWVDAIQPYAKSSQLFQCPTTKSSDLTRSDYFYNRLASGVAMEKFIILPQTILLGEGNDDAPTWASLSQLPSTWSKDQTSPLWRHLEGANYGFADGHVKFFRPLAIKTTSPQTDSSPTFAIR